MIRAATMMKNLLDAVLANCRTYGWIANYCDSCEDNGRIYEPIDADQEDDLSEAENVKEPSDADANENPPEASIN
jgi:hypothetical protein